MAIEEQDPFAKWTVKSSSETPKKEDPFEKWSKPKVDSIKNDSIINESIPKIDDEEDKGGILSDTYDWLTHTYAPKIGIERPGYDAPGGENIPFLGRALGEIGIGAYNDLIQPMSSIGGAALTLASGPLIRGGVKAAGMIPGVGSRLASLLSKEVLPGEAPAFIKKAVETMTPKGKVSPSVDTPVVDPGAVIPEAIPPIDPNAPLTPIDKLLGAVKTAKPLEAKQAKIYSAERASRIGEAEKVTTPGQRGFWEKKGKLAGEHSKVQMEPLKLEQPDVDTLFDDIGKSTLEPFQRINAGTGLEKILSGQVPQNSEMLLLSKVFGSDKIAELTSSLPKIHRADLIHEIVNIPRAMQTIWDLSMPLRQGKGLIMSQDWYKAWPAMVKSAGSEGAYKGVMESIMTHPNFKTQVLANGSKVEPFFRKAGLHITDLTDLSSREESMQAPIVEKVVPFARASNRAATAFVNKLRADHFNRLINSAEAAGLKPYENLDLAQHIGSFVNNATGRGGLGPAEKYAVGLNDALFSPRFLASRVQMLNPVNYAKLNTPEGRFVAKQYWKSAAGLTGAWLTKLKLEEYSGAKVNWDDPTSSDFLKAKWGNTVDDPGAGFQQIIVLLSRLAERSYKTGSGNEKEYGRGFGSKTMMDAITEFVTNKLAPVPKYFYDAANASEYRPFDVNDRTIREVVPMIAQDISEVVQEDPSLLPLLGGAFLGESVQVNTPEQSKMFGDSIPSFNLPRDRAKSKGRR